MRLGRYIRAVTTITHSLPPPSILSPRPWAPPPPAESFIIPEGLRDDVLDPALPGAGHLGSFFNPAASSYCSDDEFDVSSIAHAQIHLNHAVFSTNPAFSGDDITDFVYERWQSGEKLVAGSATEAWSIINAGWRALKYLAGMPGWVPAVITGDATGDATAPAAKVRALVNLTLRRRWAAACRRRICRASWPSFHT
jgi:hypothetical protein